MIYRLYRGLTTMGAPLISLYLDRRKRRGKEDVQRFPERLGRPGRSRPAGPLVWVHAASVGESLSMLPLIERLCARRLTVLVTTGTVTSAKLMGERLPKGALHQYVPVDRMAYVRGFLDHWRPDLALWAESEFWPNLLVESRRRGIGLVLVQGRVSAKSFDGWSRAPGFIRRLLSGFDLCLAQTEDDARRIRALGGRDVRCLGNLKYAVPPLPADGAGLARLNAAVAGRPVWLASSTHPGEEAVAASVHKALAARFPGLLTLIVPRHPPRGAEVAAELRGLGLRVALRSADEALGADTDIYVADTIGELGLFYRLAPIVFVGKSLAVGGGQNPFEPARIGAAVLFGPAMENFPDMAPRMVEAGAALEVADSDALITVVGELLATPERVAALTAKAAAWAEAEAGVLDAVEAVLAPALGALEKRHARS
ncbi:3-deoxy-D-manno-octulosonic acid transferase [Paramagnetospirillum kuznetsovii]|uniref:3-deoxy-D-manno-octulosonic acid transferase n=1 Tax=Paramagnetospirillum kuznetsovii TaxID=2053833 RepID=A0A364NXW5_9PROT|nr:3-deoxy-D-manno-octulosonic acid transferase [Paramagnetospirillum kuznetsovii]RAU21745.1 3-deoxy-D-manno-octulosonic acid transferase [Paramagnetospirillum kuznetsovii]